MKGMQRSHEPIVSRFLIAGIFGIAFGFTKRTVRSISSISYGGLVSQIHAKSPRTNAVPRMPKQILKDESENDDGNPAVSRADNSTGMCRGVGENPELDCNYFLPNHHQQLPSSFLLKWRERMIIRLVDGLPMEHKI
jgi:hypothetical protein